MPIAGGAVFQCRTLVWVVRNIPQKNRHYTHQWTRLSCETNLVSSVGRVISSSEYRVMNSCVDRVSSSSGVRVFRANAKAARSKRRWPPLLIFRYPTLGFQGRFSLPVPVAKPDAPNPRSRRSSYRIASGIPARPIWGANSNWGCGGILGGAIGSAAVMPDREVELHRLVQVDAVWGLVGWCFYRVLNQDESNETIAHRERFSTKPVLWDDLPQERHQTPV